MSRRIREDGNVEISQAHRRLGDDRGTCECGAPAKHWAYIGGDPDELVSNVRGMPYSLKPEFYKGMCVSCHGKFDYIHKERCQRGHDEWAARTNGKRYCLVCARQRLAIRRKKKEE